MAWLVRVGLAVGLIGLFGYLTWRGSPWLQQVPWMPGWLGRWADAHGDLRNLPAFAGLGFGLIWGLGLRAGVTVALVLAVGLEVGQIWIPTRGFSWNDIWISCAGVALAGGTVWLGRTWVAWHRGRVGGKQGVK